MKRILKSFLLLFCVLVFLPALGLQTSSFINIKKGKVENAGVLSDVDSTIFLELTDETYVVEPISRLPLASGEIMPPNEVKEPEPNQRPFIESLFVFEFYTSNFQKYVFTNKSKQRNKSIQLLMPIKDIEKGYLQLWKWKEDHWSRVGGVIKAIEGYEEKVFVAFLDGTGVYGIYNEAPAPKNNAVPYRDDEIELAEPNPNPSVEKPEEELQRLLERITFLKELIAEKELSGGSAQNGDEAGGIAPAPKPNPTATARPTPTPLPQPNIVSFAPIIDSGNAVNIEDLLEKIEKIREKEDEVPTPDEVRPDGDLPLIEIVPIDGELASDRDFSASASKTTAELGETEWFFNDPIIDENLPPFLSDAGKKSNGLSGWLVFLFVVGLIFFLGWGIWTRQRSS